MRQRWVRWLPRVLGLALAAYLGLFALDVFGPGVPLVEALVGFAIHLLPSYVVLAATWVGWRRPLRGGVAFLALLVLFALVFGPTVPSAGWWFVAGPGVLVAAAHLWAAWALRSA